MHNEEPKSQIVQQSKDKQVDKTQFECLLDEVDTLAIMVHDFDKKMGKQPRPAYAKMTPDDLDWHGLLFT